MIDVAISGAGTLGAAGAGLAEHARALAGGRLPLGEVDGSGGFHAGDEPRRALLVPPAAMRDLVDPMAARRMSAPSRFAVAAARLAVRDAKLSAGESPWRGGERAAVCFGNAWGATTYTQRLLDQIEERGPAAISPFLFMETVANAPAGQVALEHGILGPNVTLTQREASDLAAVARSAALIARGRASLVLAGAVGEMSPVLHSILARYGALTRGERARPFDRGRDGFLAAEGATVLVLEPRESALARGAPVHARIVAWGRANDPSATATDWGTGASELAAALARMLERANVPLDTIGRVVSGASGSRRGDALEARVLRGVFGDALPSVVAPKALSGEYGGGFLASALWASRAESIPAEFATEAPDPALGVASSGGSELPPARRVLVTSLSSGGPAAWLVLETS